jgi:lactoylglutathione lyase
MIPRRSVVASIAVSLVTFSSWATSGTPEPPAPPVQTWSLKMATPLEVGVVCVDIDRMINFYTGVLGLKFASEAEATAEMSKKFGATPDGFKIVRLQTPAGERIKLVQPAKVQTRHTATSEYAFERQGTAYVTFVIADIHDVAKRLKDKGVKLMSQDPVEIRKGVIALLAQDPEGNFVEFVEYADVSAYRPDLFKWKQFF